MKIILRAILITLPILFFTFFYLYINEDKYYPGADFRKFEMPIFKINSLYDESNISNDDLKGAYLVNVWASWCITCRVEHGFLSKLSNEGIPIIGLNYKDKKDDAISWITKFGDPYELIIHDLKGELALDMGVTGAPETFLLHNGNVIAQYRGEINKMIWNDVFMPVIEKEEIFNND